MWTTSQCVIVVIVIIIFDYTLIRIVGDIAHLVSHLYPVPSCLSKG